MSRWVFWGLVCGRWDSNPPALRRHPLKMVRLPVPPLPHEDGERILAGSDRQGKSNVAANKLPPRCASEGSQEWFTPLNATPGPTKPLLFSRRLRRWRLRRRRLLRRRRWLLGWLLRRRRSRGLLLRRRLRKLLKDGSARRGAEGCAQAQRNRCSHEHDRTPSGGFTEKRRRAARAECRLAAGAAKRPGQVRRFAALQQHDDNQQETRQNVNRGEQER